MNIIIISLLAFLITSIYLFRLEIYAFFMEENKAQEPKMTDEEFLASLSPERRQQILKNRRILAEAEQTKLATIEYSIEANKRANQAAEERKQAEASANLAAAARLASEARLANYNWLGRFIRDNKNNNEIPEADKKAAKALRDLYNEENLTSDNVKEIDILERQLSKHHKFVHGLYTAKIVTGAEGKQEIVNKVSM